jgi:hypothetical protein
MSVNLDSGPCYKSLAPERDKAAKIREYAVEATQ